MHKQLRYATRDLYKIYTQQHMRMCDVRILCMVTFFVRSDTLLMGEKVDEFLV